MMAQQGIQANGESDRERHHYIRLPDNDSSQNRSCKCCKSFTPYLAFFFTNWPWETMKYVSTPNNIPPPITQANADESQVKSPVYSLQLFISIIITATQLLLIAGAVFVQYVTCFRRDWIATNHTIHTAYKYHHHKLTQKNITVVTCDDIVGLIHGFLIPDMIIVLLAVWMYVGLKWGIQSFCGWKELNAVVQVDKPETLTQLVCAAQKKLEESNVTVTYTVIPVIYMILSQVISAIYLIVFFEELQSQDTAMSSIKSLKSTKLLIKPPLFHLNLSNRSTHLSTTLLHHETITSLCIGLSFIGFIFLDLLYLQVILRYAYRCQLIIYYLEILEERIEEWKNNSESTITKQDLMNNTDQAYTFIKELNTSSFTIAFVIIIAGFQAVNCAVNLLSKNIEIQQAAAVIARLVLWGFLLVFPFHKAAGINVANNQLTDLGWTAQRPSLAHVGDSGHIILKAKVLGIPIHQWFPYLIVFALLFAIMAESKIEWLLGLMK